MESSWSLSELNIAGEELSTTTTAAKNSATLPSLRVCSFYPDNRSDAGAKVEEASAESFSSFLAVHQSPVASPSHVMKDTIVSSSKSLSATSSFSQSSSSLLTSSSETILPTLPSRYVVEAALTSGNLLAAPANSNSVSGHPHPLSHSSHHFAPQGSRSPTHSLSENSTFSSSVVMGSCDVSEVSCIEGDFESVGGGVMNSAGELGDGGVIKEESEEDFEDCEGGTIEEDGDGEGEMQRSDESATGPMVVRKACGMDGEGGRECFRNPGLKTSGNANSFINSSGGGDIVKRSSALTATNSGRNASRLRCHVTQSVAVETMMPIDRTTTLDWSRPEDDSFDNFEVGYSISRASTEDPSAEISQWTIEMLAYHTLQQQQMQLASADAEAPASTSSSSGSSVSLAASPVMEERFEEEEKRLSPRYMGECCSGIFSESQQHQEEQQQMQMQLRQTSTDSGEETGVVKEKISAEELRNLLLDFVKEVVKEDPNAEVNVAQELQRILKVKEVYLGFMTHPSLGALLHEEGYCKPCVFANKNNKTCHNGSSCYFCHHFHKEKRRRTKKSRGQKETDAGIPPPPPVSAATPRVATKFPPPPPPPPPPSHSADVEFALRHCFRQQLAAAAACPGSCTPLAGTGGGNFSSFVDRSAFFPSTTAATTPVGSATSGVAAAVGARPPHPSTMINASVTSESSGLCGSTDEDSLTSLPSLSHLQHYMQMQSDAISSSAAAPNFRCQPAAANLHSSTFDFGFGGRGGPIESMGSHVSPAPAAEEMRCPSEMTEERGAEESLGRQASALLQVLSPEDLLKLQAVVEEAIQAKTRGGGRCSGPVETSHAVSPLIDRCMSHPSSLSTTAVTSSTALQPQGFYPLSRSSTFSIPPPPGLTLMSSKVASSASSVSSPAFPPLHCSGSEQMSSFLSAGAFASSPSAAVFSPFILSDATTTTAATDAEVALQAASLFASLAAASSSPSLSLNDSMQCVTTTTSSAAENGNKNNFNSNVPKFRATTTPSNQCSPEFYDDELSNCFPPNSNSFPPRDVRFAFPASPSRTSEHYSSVFSTMSHGAESCPAQSLWGTSRTTPSLDALPSATTMSSGECNVYSCSTSSSSSSTDCESTAAISCNESCGQEGSCKEDNNSSLMLSGLRSTAASFSDDLAAIASASLSTFTSTPEEYAIGGADTTPLSARLYQDTSYDWNAACSAMVDLLSLDDLRLTPSALTSRNGGFPLLRGLGHFSTSSKLMTSVAGVTAQNDNSSNAGGGRSAVSSNCSSTSGSAATMALDLLSNIATSTANQTLDVTPREAGVGNPSLCSSPSALINPHSIRSSEFCNTDSSSNNSQWTLPKIDVFSVSNLGY